MASTRGRGGQWVGGKGWDRGGVDSRLLWLGLSFRCRASSRVGETGVYLVASYIGGSTGRPCIPSLIVDPRPSEGIWRGCEIEKVRSASPRPTDPLSRFF